jgi:hypothetical protein
MAACCHGARTGKPARVTCCPASGRSGQVLCQCSAEIQAANSEVRSRLCPAAPRYSTERHGQPLANARMAMLAATRKGARAGRPGGSQAASGLGIARTRRPGCRRCLLEGRRRPAERARLGKQAPEKASLSEWQLQVSMKPRSRAVGSLGHSRDPPRHEAARGRARSAGPARRPTGAPPRALRPRRGGGTAAGGSRRPCSDPRRASSCGPATRVQWRHGPISASSSRLACVHHRQGLICSVSLTALPHSGDSVGPAMHD